MGNRDIKKDVKKKKKSDVSAAIPSLKPIASQPEVIKKAKKNV